MKKSEVDELYEWSKDIPQPYSLEQRFGMFNFVPLELFIAYASDGSIHVLLRSQKMAVMFL